MKKYFYIFAIVFLNVVFASCEKDPVEEKTADKTIFIYMPYTADKGANGSLYKCFQQNINGIRSSIINNNGLGNNNVIVFMSLDKSTAHLFKFNYKRGAIVYDTLRIYKDQAITTETGISQVLNDVMEYAPAQKYGMIVGAHGQGWLPATEAGPNKSRHFGSSYAGYQTNVSTFGNALRTADMHLQFLLFDCCYMACIENVYELRDVTDYYISSTSEIMDIGMPYEHVFHSLMLSEPNYEALSNKFHAFYENYNMPYGTISVVDCRYVDEIASKMRNINLHYEFDTEKLSEIQDLDAAYHTPTIYFDFGDYVDHLCTDETELEVFHRSLDKLVPYKSTTDYIYSSKSPYPFPVDAFSGLTISDPSTNTLAITKDQTPWWQATH